MTYATSQDAATTDSDERLSVTAPDALRERGDVQFSERERTVADREHCGAGVAGRAVVGVQNDDGEFLLLVHDEMGVAVLPHATVEADGDWAARARQGIEDSTGVSIALDGIEAVRHVEHVVDGEREPHTATHRVVFSGTPTGGQIWDSTTDDGWRAGWFAALPDDIDAPSQGGPAEDFRLVLE